MNNTPQFFWELIQRDGTIIEIPPDAVEVVKRRWESGQPIHTKYSGSIPPNQIVAFRPTDKPANAQPMLEEVARAFNEPVHGVSDDGEEFVVVRWVKKHVTQSKYDKYYAPTGYKKIGEGNGMIIVAWRQPLHMIDPLVMQYCTDNEIKQLER